MAIAVGAVAGVGEGPPAEVTIAVAAVVAFAVRRRVER